VSSDALDVTDVREIATRAELGELVAAELTPADADQPQRSKHRLGLAWALNWLETFPGATWQERWLLAEAAKHESSWWGPDGLRPGQRSSLTLGVRFLIVLRAIRPSYAWLSSSRLLGMYAAFRRHNQPEAFAEIERHTAARDGYNEYATEAVNALTRMVIVTGKNLHDLDSADFDDYAAARRTSGRLVSSLPLVYELLQAVGGLDGQPSSWREARTSGQRSVTEIVDQWPIANRAIRDVLVCYLTERSAALDYASVVNQGRMLASLFWGDLERHHPGIDSLQLSESVAQGWKQRLRTLPDGRPRRTAHSVLLTVRAFYLDLQQWALEDPPRWAEWSAPCPIRDADVRGHQKQKRQRQARMQQRTRTLIPVLPRLVTAANDHLTWAGRVLESVHGVDPGQQFLVDGKRYQRTVRQNGHRPSALFVTALDEPGPRFDAERVESDAFWTMATIEVLRRTGARIEELLELTHLSLRQYQDPTGEMVALVQISPSKTDHERVIPADPELIAILARIIRRIKSDTGTVPLVSRFDNYERVFGSALPHLFQRTIRGERRVITAGTIRDLLTRLAERAGVTDVDGTVLRFSPHDFRRIFSTETVNSGLPIHIAAKLLGHLDLNTTQGYVAVYPEEVISHYRRFVEQRRAGRPGDEYREPTDAEWEEFRDHFSLRKVALGRCDRPYGTPCQHEHACIRCPMLRLSLEQAPRLLEIERNTHERLEEAHQMQWLGEVSALKESLRHIANKKQQAERLQQQADQHEAGVDALG
jgi:integrase